MTFAQIFFTMNLVFKFLFGEGLDGMDRHQKLRVTRITLPETNIAKIDPSKKEMPIGNHHSYVTIFMLVL